MSDKTHISITDFSRERGVNPRIVSDWLWKGRIDRDRCVRVAGRTLLERSYADAVVVPELRRAGYLPALQRGAPRA